MTGGEDPADAAALDDLRLQVAELRRALAEIGGGGVDALVVGDPADPAIYTLTPAERPYRFIVERMGEGALTVSEHGVVLYANPRMGDFLGAPADAMAGRDIVDFVPVDQLPELTRLLGDTGESTRRAELVLPGADDVDVPYLVTATDIVGDDLRLRCLVFTDLTMQKLIEQQVAQEAARTERQQVAVEVNDTIVQGLVAAEMALDLDHHDLARRVIARTSDHARQWIGALTGAESIQPGTAVRSHPARAGEETP